MKRNTEIVEAYGYDANGNRILHTSVEMGITNQSATYTQGDQLQSRGNTSYSYDANGRLSSKLESNDDELSLTTYIYSSLGQLLQVDTPDKSIRYLHNALGNRVAKLINGQVVEQYLWQDLTTLLAVYDGQGNLKQRFEYTLGHTPTSFTQNGQRYFIQTDHLGSPRVIADSSGNIVKTISYDSYGNITHDSNSDFQIPFGFAGGLYDQNTKLIRFGYRDYDPETGRWTARDPIGFAGGDTNLYGYVLGDSINFYDPDGLQVRPSRNGLGSGGTHGGAGGVYGQVIGNGYTSPSGRYVPPSIPLLRSPNYPPNLLRRPPIDLKPGFGNSEQEIIRNLIELGGNLLEKSTKEKIMCELNPLACMLKDQEKYKYCSIGS